MARKSQLVEQHLERVAAGVFEDYQRFMREYTRRRHGIYALYKGNRLYYVGLARSLQMRLKQHLKDRHQGKWDHFSVYLTQTDSHLRELETLVLRIASPKGNRVAGRLRGSLNIRKSLQRDIREDQRRVLRRLFGDSFFARRITQRRSRSRNGKKEPSLARYVTRRFTIRHSYKDKTYKDSVRSNGWIQHKGKLYSSPSSLASAICTRSTNGWHFWRYKTPSGAWVQLKRLRK